MGSRSVRIALFFTALLLEILLFAPSLHSRAQDSFREDGFQDATDYLVGQFASHDVILLGECHRLHDHARFVAELIPVLQQNGIHLLYSEFANADDSALIDALTTGPVFDENLAQDICWRNMWDWGYQEYAEVYRAVWETNSRLVSGEEPFRIIGLESEDYGGLDPERAWAGQIRTGTLDVNRKAIVWCGLHHAFSHYFHPYVVKDSLNGFVTSRAGNFLYRRDPGRVMTVVLHAPLKAMPGTPYSHVMPGNGILDSLAVDWPPFGFSTEESPFGDLSLANTFYAWGYSDLRLKQLCQGYIVVNPLCRLKMVSLIPSFINPANLEQTREKAGLGNLSAGALNDTIAAWLADESEFLLNIQKRSCPDR